MNYKLVDNWDGILHISDNVTSIMKDGRGWREYQAWLAAGNTPLPADVPTAEELAKEEEVREAPGIARGWFAGHQAAINFIRLSPAEQEAAIEGYTNAQMKTLLKYLTVAVAMIIKERLLP